MANLLLATVNFERRIGYTVWYCIVYFRELHPDMKEDLKRLKAHLSESSTELAAFKVWQLQGESH